MFRLFKSVALLAVSQAIAGAQTSDTATIHGHVVDESQASVPDANITIDLGGTSGNRTRRSDRNGDFTIVGLSVSGAWTLTIAKQGFAAAKQSGIALQAGVTAEIQIRLDVAAGNTRISVTGTPGEVRTDAPQLGDRIAGRQLQETTMPDRRITWLPLLNSANRPAINQGDIFTNQNLFTTNGAGRRQTWFDADGASDNDNRGGRRSSAPFLYLPFRK